MSAWKQLTNLPWHAIRLAILTFRRLFYTVEWPEGAPSVIVDVSAMEDSDPIEAIGQTLQVTPDLAKRREGGPFEPLALMSAVYQGEDLNLRRPAGGAKIGGQMVSFQDHVRARRIDENRAEANMHREASPWTTPKLHLRGDYFSWETARLATHLDEHTANDVKVEMAT